MLEAHRRLDESPVVVRVVDLPRGVFSLVFAEDAVTQAVPSRGLRSRNAEALESLVHLVGRVTGEGHSENARWVGPIVDEERDPAAEGLSLAGASPGEHASRTAVVSNDLRLLMV